MKGDANSQTIQEKNYLSHNMYTFELAHWLRGRMFANGLGDRGSISGRVIPKTQKAVLDN